MHEDIHIFYILGMLCGIFPSFHKGTYLFFFGYVLIKIYRQKQENDSLILTIREVAEVA